MRWKDLQGRMIGKRFQDLDPELKAHFEASFARYRTAFEALAKR